MFPRRVFDKKLEELDFERPFAREDNTRKQWNLEKQKHHSPLLNDLKKSTSYNGNEQWQKNFIDSSE